MRMTQTLPFNELGLSPTIMQAIEEIGYEEATPIQTRTIPLLMEGKDLIGQSQTGTGKTAAFAIPAIEKLLGQPYSKNPRVLVLCPTRELAMQACEEIRKLTAYARGIRPVAVYGGADIERQIRLLRAGAQIVVGTPGRVMDHMRRHTLLLQELQTVILDEADEMLSMGFREDIETIFQDVPDERQTVLFSATMSPEILAITEQYLREPAFIKAVQKELTVDKIEQYYYTIPHSLKIEALSRLMDVYQPRPAMIFCNTKKQVDELTSAMQQRGYVAEGLHGDMKQAARDHVMNTFRSGSVDILIATDVAARGIDVSGVGAVFNYDIPQDVEYYVHRIGRTGRAGQSGLAFTFVTGSREMGELRGIMHYTRADIKKGYIPTGADVTESRRRRFADQVRAAVEQGGLEPYAAMVEQMEESGISPAAIAAALLKYEMTAGGKTAMPSEADDAAFARQEKRSERGDRYDNRRSGGRDGGRRGRHDRSETNVVRLSINIGSVAGIAPKHIVGAVAGETGLPGRMIGRIEIAEKSSAFTVPAEAAPAVISALNKTRIMGRRVRCEAVGE